MSETETEELEQLSAEEADSAEDWSAGEGEAGPNAGAAGDLYVAVHLKKHPIFHFWK